MICPFDVSYPASKTAKVEATATGVPGLLYRFESYELDVERHEFRAGGEGRVLEPQVFDLLRHLIENMSAGFYIHDDQCPIFINRALSDMYGYADTKELMDIGDLSLLWSPKDATRIQGLAENCKRDGAAPHTYECEGFKKDGSQIWMRITSQTVQWQGRTLISGTIHDITEERRSEEAFLERNRWFRQVV